MSENNNPAPNILDQVQLKNHGSKPNFDEQNQAIDTLERDILQKLWTVYNSRFWIGAIHDSDQYKAGVKSLRQVVKLLNGLMEIKKDSPLNNIFDDTPPSQEVF